MFFGIFLNMINIQGSSAHAAAMRQCFLGLPGWRRLHSAVPKLSVLATFLIQK